MVILKSNIFILIFFFIAGNARLEPGVETESIKVSKGRSSRDSAAGTGHSPEETNSPNPLHNNGDSRLESTPTKKLKPYQLLLMPYVGEEAKTNEDKRRLSGTGEIDKKEGEASEEDESTLERVPAEVPSDDDYLQPNFYYTVFEKVFCSYYLSSSSPYLDKRRKFMENCTTLALNENITSKSLDEIFAYELKANGKTISDKKEKDYVGISMLLRELSRIDFFKFLSCPDSKAGRSFDFMKVILAGLKIGKSKSAPDFVPFSELAQSFKNNYNELVKKMAPIETSNPIFEFEQAVTLVSTLCGFKYLQITGLSSVSDVIADGPISYDVDELQSILDKIVSGDFISSMKSQLTRIDNFFIYLSKTIDDLKTEKMDPYVVCYNSLYGITSDFIAIRSLVDLVISINSFDSKTYLSLSSLLSGDPTSTEKLSMSITDCAIALFMNAIGYNEQYYASRKENFSEKNINWWFDNKVDEALPIGMIGAINEHGFYDKAIIAVNEAESLLLKIESKAAITEKQCEEISAKLDTLKKMVAVIPYKIYSESLISKVANLQHRFDHVKEKYGTVKADEKK